VLRCCSCGRSRTGNRPLNRRVLCQLSYAGPIPWTRNPFSLDQPRITDMACPIDRVGITALGSCADTLAHLGILRRYDANCAELVAGSGFEPPMSGL
jgi:hypothetical protein